MLVTMVAGKAPLRWDDEVIFEFENQLQEIVSRIESQALEAVGDDRATDAGINLASLVERRIGDLVAKLEQLTGEVGVRKALSKYVDQGSKTKDKNIGYAKRSA